MENQEPTKPTGNLEELFRHHLAEAAVPPRMHVWEQVDNALLIAQNETYRRRLVVTRWVAAASLLFASLAGTGWLATTQRQPAGELAQDGSGMGSVKQAGPATLRRKGAAADVAAAADVSVAARSGVGAAGSVAATTAKGNEQEAGASTGRTAASVATQRSSRTGGALLASVTHTSAGRSRNTPSGNHDLASTPITTTATYSSSIVRDTQTPPSSYTSVGKAEQEVIVASASRLQAAQTLGARNSAPATRAAANGSDATGTVAAIGTPKSQSLALMPDSPASGSELQAASRSQVTAAAPLNAMLVRMAQMPLKPLPAPLALQPTAAEEPATQARRWRLSLAYTAGLFQSNVNFSRAGIDPAYAYNPALGANSPALSESAASEHKAQQRPGLGQRFRVQAIRRLGGHWSLATGLEVAQQQSYSATSYIFTGEQIPDLSQRLEGGIRQESSVRYRTAGLPLELRYANPVKTGFSLYGRVGAVVSALLTTRTDVEQEPEATRTYNILSGSTPYRRVLGALRGAAGIQFRPVGHDYTLSLGPVAEGGLWSLNRHPAQGFLQQSRPYSFGLEAAVEFGRNMKLSKL